jgi:putrescine---pyruvate transaminase
MAKKATSNFLRENNARQVWRPMAHPNEMDGSPPRIIVSGEGSTVTDIDGRRVVDAVVGLWNVDLGYSNAAIKQAIAEQLAALPYYSAFRGTTHPRLIELGHRLVEALKPEEARRAFFTSGGSDSVESALRIARQYWKVRGQADRVKFLALKKGYHGTHFGGASVNGNSNFRRAYEPLLPGVFHAPTPFLYRNPFNESDPDRLAALCLNAIEDEIKFQGADTIAAASAEPVQGAGGVIVFPGGGLRFAQEAARHLRYSADCRRGRHRFRPRRSMVRSSSRWCEAGLHVHSQGDYLGLFPPRRRFGEREN